MSGMVASCPRSEVHPTHHWSKPTYMRNADSVGVSGETKICPGLIAEPESAANGPSPTPSETRQDRIRRAAAEIRSWPGFSFDHAALSLIADLIEAASGFGSRWSIADANDRLARSILGEPGDDR